ncbi:MAG: acetyltransferase [Bacteroidota bacterium]
MASIIFDKKILIIGASGFGREVLTCLIDNLGPSGKNIREIACFMETKEFYQETQSIHGVPVIPDEQFDPLEYHVLVGIGEPSVRKKVVEGLPEETRFATLIHPSAIISEWVEIGEGSIITAGTIATTDIVIGKHAQLNLHTTIGHDCQIGDYFTTAPGTNISGLCQFGDCVYFGTNAATRQGIKICDHVTIGMGGVVVKHISEPGIYIGNPAKKLERKK